MAATGKAVLVTGASGLVGRLLAAVILAHTDEAVLLPTRDLSSSTRLQEGLAVELAALGAPVEALQRAKVVQLPAIRELSQLAPLVAELDVREIVHCAGSMSYHDKSRLQEGNVDLTRELLELAANAKVERFVYMSTAFSSGIVDGTIPETLHEGSRNDPAEYMTSKRETEWLVARSGLPYLILRPSIVIGDSRDGRYPGRPYGLYQVWSSAEKFASKRYMPVIHAVAPRVPLQVVHQDALQAAFFELYRSGARDAVVHIAGREEALPTVRDLWDLWLQSWLRPEEIHYYESMEDVPLQALDRDQRLFVQFAASNIEISTHAWRFETGTLDELRRKGLEFPDATLETVGIAQARFLSESPRIQEFFARFPEKRSREPKVFESTIKPGT